MSALVFEKRTGLGSCINDCKNAKSGRRRASYFVSIATWPVGPVCEACKKEWRSIWDAYREEDDHGHDV